MMAVSWSKASNGGMPAWTRRVVSTHCLAIYKNEAHFTLPRVHTLLYAFRECRYM
jgi:hypothetical protein